MILVDHDCGLECELKTDQLTVLVLEKIETFVGFIERLEAQIDKVEDKLLLYDADHSLLDVSKKCAIVFSARDLTYQSTKIQKKLYSIVAEETVENNLQERLVQNHAELLQIADSIKTESEYELTYNEEFEFQNICKYLSLRLEEPSGTFCEKIMSYAKITREFLHTEIFFLINCKAYFKKEEYACLQKWAAYQEICIVMVERDENRLPSGLNKYIMDEDNCLIH